MENGNLQEMIRERLRSLRQQLRQRRTDSQNQRRSLRRPFAYKQRIAPYSTTVPDQSAFVEVMCRDISTTGFSFQAKAEPDFSQIIVELGVSPNLIYVVARVARVSRQAEEDYVIGCEFTHRHM